MNPVYILAELAESGPRECAREIIGEGRALADKLSAPLVILAVGQDLERHVAALSKQDADRICLIEDPRLAEYSTETWVTALAELFQAQPPAAALFSDTPNGRDLTARLAARLRWPVIIGCVWVKLSPLGEYICIQPSHQDQLYTTYTYPSNQLPLLASLRPGAIGIDPSRSPRVTEVTRWQPQLSGVAVRVRREALIPGDPRQVDLLEAELIVSGGRGVGSQADWRLIKETADALGASVGGSRMALDLGYITPERMVGQTGRSVRPRLYLAAGISGVPHHLGGVEAESLLAINSDRGAPIFKQCSLGVVGDLHALLPALAERIRQEKAGGAR